MTLFEELCEDRSGTDEIMSHTSGQTPCPFAVDVLLRQGWNGDPTLCWFKRDQVWLSRRDMMRRICAEGGASTKGISKGLGNKNGSGNKGNKLSAEDKLKKSIARKKWIAENPETFSEHQRQRALKLWAMKDDRRK